MRNIYKLKFWNISKLLKVSNIIYRCGKDMAMKWGLHHWDNSRVKTWIIIALCLLKNDIYLIYDEKVPIATFQTRKIKESFLFQKLAILPELSGRGIGTWCINEIERLAKLKSCQEVICEVYERSEHAKLFYERKDYVVYGTVNSFKYMELKLKKKL